MNTGGPAFPAHTIAMHEGMTLRDYFAAKAMQGLISSHHCGKDFSATQKAKDAYVIADEMLKAREA